MTSPLQPAAQRRALSRAARDAFPPMGVYAVRDAASGTVRVHASRNVHGAINRTQFELRLGCHFDKALQAEWNQDPSRFTFEVLAFVKERQEPGFDPAEELRVLEALYREELCGAEAPHASRWG